VTETFEVMMNVPMPAEPVLKLLKNGTVIPAHPLALTRNYTLDEKHQRALTRYYLACGVRGVAVAVHTTQFEIRLPKFSLLQPVLEMALQEIQAFEQSSGSPIVKIAGVVGQTEQAEQEAALARDLGYDMGLLSLSAFKHATLDEMIRHCHVISSIIPLVGFYLQPAVGGRKLEAEFWRRFAQIENVVAIKIAPFNAYETLEVLRGVAASGRAQEIALYTGNDNSIITDLLTPFVLPEHDQTLHFAGGLLGHWSVWTRTVVEQFNMIKAMQKNRSELSPAWLTLAAQITDCNAAFFDARNNFHGCIVGVHEVLRRQGLLQGNWTLNPSEHLADEQSREIDRVYQAYPHLNDDVFVAEHLDEWLNG
jgi:dihydrodipicolinate synthase/N-acetylneuraminate lyase